MDDVSIQQCNEVAKEHAHLACSREQICCNNQGLNLSSRLSAVPQQSMK